MGGTGLEPVTPSLSNAPGGSPRYAASGERSSFVGKTRLRVGATRSLQPPLLSIVFPSLRALPGQAEWPEAQHLLRDGWRVRFREGAALRCKTRRRAGARHQAERRRRLHRYRCARTRPPELPLKLACDRKADAGGSDHRDVETPLSHSSQPW